MAGLLSWWSRVALVSLCSSALVSCFVAEPRSAKPLELDRECFPSLINITIDELTAGLESGKFTSVDLVNAYIERILEVNDTLNVVTELNPDALSIAEALDEERAAGAARGALHGIPILIKNNIATNDAMNNTAGSWSLVGSEVPEDSTLANKLREAGAIILGKANLSQWANYRSSNSSNGWSAYGGQVYAAYHEDQDPSGSSSGSGVAASLGLALAALGTETSGSILSPSNRNDVVGIKPTVGLTSRYLVIPISEHQDTVGPMARTVKDAAYVLQVLAGYDEHDNYTSAIPNDGVIPDYVAACDPDALNGARIGVPTNVIEYYTSGFTAMMTEVDAFYADLDVFRDAGAEIVLDANYTAWDQYTNSSNTTIVLQADFITNIAEYLAELTVNPNDITNLEELRAWTQAEPLEDYPDRNTAVWDGALEAGFGNTDPRFWEAYQANQFLGGEGGVLGALERNSLDAIILPTSFSPGNPAVVGAPGINVPLGFYPPDANVTMNSRGNLVATGPNVPFGISFLGRRFSEETLIGLAYAYEQLTFHRDDVQPYIEPTVELACACGH
ncbi:amidase [Lineolata rhizophorae]|uniref:Amidase n=1 Tax=Lineolata rhizophorae TaxID=578093 RepID=A0A6A6NRE4_9PEZI|nr:amidase [Lineolata rhizophorae]